MILLLLSVFTVFFNIPFGYYRVSQRKYSLGWFLAIHLPVPFIIFLRYEASLGISAIPIFVACAILGQILGGKLHPLKVKS